jgi:hypothetical protein
MEELLGLMKMTGSLKVSFVGSSQRIPLSFSSAAFDPRPIPTKALGHGNALAHVHVKIIVTTLVPAHPGTT